MCGFHMFFFGWTQVLRPFRFLLWVELSAHFLF